MRITTLLLLLSVAGANLGYAQILSRITNYNIGYFGHLGVHPGLTISVDFPIKTVEFLRDKKKDPKIITKSWYVVPNLGFYHHVRNQNVFSSGIDFNRRRETQNRFYRSFGFGSRLMVGFNAGETFDVNKNGEIHKKKVAASYHIGLNTNYTLGWKMSSSQNPCRVFTRFHTTWMFNYNQTIVPSINLELGVKLPIEKLFKPNVPSDDLG